MSTGYRNIIVPVTGEDDDTRLLQLVNQMGSHHRMNVTLVFVVEVPQALPLDADMPAEIDRGEVVLDRAERLAAQLLVDSAGAVTTDLLQARTAGAAIVDEAIERDADAIVMTARLRIHHGRPTTGDTASYVVRNAPCDVIVLRSAESFSHVEGQRS